MERLDERRSLLQKLLFPTTFGRRVLYHVGFWIGYVLLHYSYAIPTLARKASDPTVTLIGFLYFLKVIPTYYLSVGLYNLLGKHLRGFRLFIVLLVTMLLVNHLSMLGVFSLVDQLHGLERMPPRFQESVRYFLNNYRPGDPDFGLVVLGSIEELQFLMIPVALKMAKYAVQENSLRQKLQNEALRMELIILKAQINPHFVFNVINAAYAKVLPVSEEAAQYLEKASEILRFSLYEANDEFIQLTKELTYLNQYVELEAIRSNRRSSVWLKQEGEARPEHQIPTLLLITLVENAFKHAVHATIHPSFVDIQINIGPQALDFVIVNSKPNPPALLYRSSERAGGIGLANLEKRMAIYYPGRHVFEKTETDHDFRVHLYLPLS